MAGIGTLGEKTLHAYLKNFIEPDTSRHEVKLGRYIADILRSDGSVVEIQTRSYHKLRPKLDAFLGDHAVTVVFPMPVVKYLSWIDPHTGASSPRRKSPKVYTLNDALWELSMIRDYLTHPKLSVRFIALSLTEYRLPSSNGSHGRGSVRVDRVPEAVLNDFTIASPRDYRAAVPTTLSDTFTVTEYAAAAHINRKRAEIAVRLLTYLSVLETAGKRGRAALYRIKGDDGECT